MKVLERAAGHASGPYRLPDDRRRGDRGADEQPGVRRFPRLRRQPGAVRHGGRHRPAGRRGRASAPGRCGYRNAVDAGRGLGAGTGDGRRIARAPARAWRRSSPPTTRPSPTARRSGLGFGLKNSGLGNGFVEIVKAVVRFSEDGDVEVRHCWTEMGQGVHTVALQVAVEELGVDPRRVRVRRRHDPRARRRPDDRLARARSWVRVRSPTPAGSALADGCRPGVDYEGEYRVDWTNSIEGGPREPGHPLRVLLRRPARDRRP